LIDGEFGTNVCRYLFYFKFFASDNFILFATGFYDRVHDRKPHQMLKESLPATSRQACAEPGEPVIIHGLKFSVKTMHKPARSWYVHNGSVERGARRAGGSAISRADFAGVPYNPHT
jgi:hypothetical protein